MNINDLRAKFKAAQAVGAKRLTVDALKAHAQTATHYDIRVRGLGERGLRFALKAIGKDGSLTIVSPAGEEVTGVALKDVTIDPCSAMAPIGANPFDSGKP